MRHGFQGPEWKGSDRYEARSSQPEVSRMSLLAGGVGGGRGVSHHPNHLQSPRWPLQSMC